MTSKTEVSNILPITPHDHNNWPYYQTDVKQSKDIVVVTFHFLVHIGMYIYCFIDKFVFDHFIIFWWAHPQLVNRGHLKKCIQRNICLLCNVGFENKTQVLNVLLGKMFQQNTSIIHKIENKM